MSEQKKSEAVEPRYVMTEEEGAMLLELRNAYYREFSKMVAEYLKRVPRDLQDVFLEQLQEQSSVYGSAFEEHLERSTPGLERLHRALDEGIPESDDGEA